MEHSVNEIQISYREKLSTLKYLMLIILPIVKIDNWSNEMNHPYLGQWSLYYWSHNNGLNTSFGALTVRKSLGSI